MIIFYFFVVFFCFGFFLALIVRGTSETKTGGSVNRLFMINTPCRVQRDLVACHTNSGLVTDAPRLRP